ncbi:MAG TPA: dihydrodipicolinate synthase family protein, partial [Paracoccaceae bacterium]|nr:dihydrodipicolinate synthase family protein [Paracoccaceae bacterium]
QRHHFKAILSAAPDLPAVIYNSPYYGFETKADLFFAIRAEHPNLVGFKEFGGAKAMTYAAEHITSADDGVILMAGVDTGVFHGYVKCGATGTITGIGNVIPKEILHFVALAKAAAKGDLDARTRAQELGEALEVLSSWDEGCDLVLYYKHMMVLQGDAEYALHFNPTDALTPSQRGWAETQLAQFKAWYAEWSKLPGAVQTCKV